VPSKLLTANALFAYASMVMPQIEQFIQITQVSALAIKQKAISIKGTANSANHLLLIAYC
jgi:hypothetical protein